MVRRVVTPTMLDGDWIVVEQDVDIGPGRCRPDVRKVGYHGPGGVPGGAWPRSASGSSVHGVPITAPSPELAPLAPIVRCECGHAVQPNTVDRRGYERTWDCRSCGRSYNGHDVDAAIERHRRATQGRRGR